MKELKEMLIANLKGYSFEELESLLNKQQDPDVRGTIMDAMEKYHKTLFMKWIGE